MCLGSTLFLFAAAGCGGGGTGGASGATPPQTRQVTPVLTVNWAGRSRSAPTRDVSAPASALSASITVTGTAGSSVSYNEDRPSGTAAVIQAYTAPTGITVQDNPTVRVVFYAQPGGAGGNGAVTASVSAVVPIQDDGTIATTITNVQSAIAAIAVAPNQSVNAGQQAYLSYSATNASGQIIALAPGSAFFTVTGGSNVLSVTGEVDQGLAGGSASVTATVDGLVSAPATVTVIPAPRIALVANGQSAQVVSFLQQMQAVGITPDRMDAVPDPVTLQSYDVLAIWSGNSTGGNVSSSDATRVLAFLNTGRGVVLLGSAPVQLAGTTGGNNPGDLSSIAAWFGGARLMAFPNTGSNNESDNDAYARTSPGNFPLPATISPGALVYTDAAFANSDYRPIVKATDIQNPASDLVLGNKGSGEVDAFAYALPGGGGRVYWQFSPTGLNPTYAKNVFSLFIAGMGWTAKR